MKKIILLSLSLCLAIIFTSCQSENDTFETRRQAAKELLSKDCGIITDASTEFIKRHPTVKELVGGFVAEKCDCITDSLAVQFANEFSLVTIKNMQNEPIETTQKAIVKVLDKNNDAFMGCLFGI